VSKPPSVAQVGSWGTCQPNSCNTRPKFYDHGTTNLRQISFDRSRLIDLGELRRRVFSTEETVHLVLLTLSGHCSCPTEFAARACLPSQPRHRETFGKWRWSGLENSLTDGFHCTKIKLSSPISILWSSYRLVSGGRLALQQAGLMQVILSAVLNKSKAIVAGLASTLIGTHSPLLHTLLSRLQCTRQDLAG
jgi:hypothetical protein